MSRQTADIVADEVRAVRACARATRSQSWPGDMAQMMQRESELADRAADRLAELDAENDELHTQIDLRDSDGNTIDALRPTCPTCGGGQLIYQYQEHQYGVTHGAPCPDCVDGRMPFEREHAIVNAVFDDQPYDGDLPTEIKYLRSVKP